MLVHAAGTWLGIGGVGGEAAHAGSNAYRCWSMLLVRGWALVGLEGRQRMLEAMGTDAGPCCWYVVGWALVGLGGEKAVVSKHDIFWHPTWVLAKTKCMKKGGVNGGHSLTDGNNRALDAGGGRVSAWFWCGK